MNILQQIFKNHFYTVSHSDITIRDAVFENVDKMVHCGDYKRGFAVYGCEHCGNIKIVPFRCRSRFCTSCGNLYAQKRATAMSLKLIRARHRHCVFIIPKELRPFFLKDRQLLNCLFNSVSSVIFRWFHKLNKSLHFTPGFICVFHTFGRSLQWNPHIHAILTEGGLGDNNIWRPCTHYFFALYSF